MKILVPVDDKLFAEVILAFMIKQDWPRESTIRCLHVVSPLHDAFVWPSKVDQENAEALLVNVETRFKLAMPNCTVEHAIVHGPISQSILKEAENFKADMIVMGSHSRSGLGKAFMGSVSSFVARNAKQPVIVLRPSLKTESAAESYESKPIWLEQIGAAHLHYLADHLGEHPFPVDGSDWSRLVAMRLEHEYYHPEAQCKQCEDLLTKLQHPHSTLERERHSSAWGMQHWFVVASDQYKPPLDIDEAGIHALKALSQINNNNALEEAEKQWLQKRTKAWIPAVPGGFWIAQRGEEFESGAQCKARDLKFTGDVPEEDRHLFDRKHAQSTRSTVADEDTKLMEDEFSKDDLTLSSTVIEEANDDVPSTTSTK